MRKLHLRWGGRRGGAGNGRWPQNRDFSRALILQSRQTRYLTTMPADSDLNTNECRTAIQQRDAASLADCLMAHSYVLIHLRDEDDSDELGALTAELDGSPYLVAFTGQSSAAEFVELRADLFGDDEVGGFIVDGETLLDYIAEGYGLLLNADLKSMCRVDSELVSDVLDELNLD